MPSSVVTVLVELAVPHVCAEKYRELFIWRHVVLTVMKCILFHITVTDVS